MNKTGMKQGDWVIREGPEIKVGDFGMFNGELMPNPLTMELGHRELQNALAFTGHSVFVLDVTDSHMVIFDPFQAQPIILQLSNFTGTWRLATQMQVEATWTIAMKAIRQDMVPLLQAVVSKYPYREPRNR